MATPLGEWTGGWGGGRGLAMTFEWFSSLRMNAPVCFGSDDWVVGLLVAVVVWLVHRQLWLNE